LYEQSQADEISAKYALDCRMTAGLIRGGKAKQEDVDQLAKSLEPIPTYGEMRELIANNPIAQALEKVENYFGESLFKPALFDYVRGQISLDTLLDGTQGHLVRESKGPGNVVTTFQNKQAAILANLGAEVYFMASDEDQANKNERFFFNLAYELDDGDITLEEAWIKINDYDLRG